MSIDETRVVTLADSVHPLARAEFDQGMASAATRLDRLLLVLEPTAAQQAGLDALVEAQHDPASPLYHQWLTPAEYGARFGASEQDLARVTAWLKGHGFTVEEIPAGRRVVVFSGTVGQVLDTFHTGMHRYRVGGASHIANVQDPQIPSALAGVVGGVVSLHDFRRTSAIGERRLLGAQASVGAQPQYTTGSTHYLFPADFAAIYDLNPLYEAGTAGAGTAIAIVGRSNINLSDVAAFRSLSGLAANNPEVILVGANPGLVPGDQDESTLDVEWSGAVAPAATVALVTASSTATTDGVDLAAQYIVNHAMAPVVSLSYGSCEQEMGAAELAFYNSLWQQAASQGMSAFVASGDAGAAGCSLGSASQGTQTAVNGLCSSPYSTCVGGTEFNEGGNAARYWSAANSANYGSALGYIPEEAWNESRSNGGVGLWATGGGASVVYAQPSWQAEASGASASNGMRAVPDVSMAAAGHDGYITVENGSDWVISGTSAAAPSFAGVMALVVQKKGAQGNANAGLYPLLNAARNPFHATPTGNNSVPGVAGFTASGAAYNLATGLGSVDGAVLVSSWGPESDPRGGETGADFALTASSSSGTLLAGETATFMIGVAENAPAKNAVVLSASAPAGVSVSFSSLTLLPGSTATVTVTVGPTAAAGTQTLIFTGSDASGTETLTYALTVTAPPTLALATATSSIAVSAGGSVAVRFAVATAGEFSGNIGFSASGLPAGVSAGWSANPIAPVSGASLNTETLTLTAANRAPSGSAVVVVTAVGGGLAASQSLTVQVQPRPACRLSLLHSGCNPSLPVRLP